MCGQFKGSALCVNKPDDNVFGANGGTWPLRGSIDLVDIRHVFKPQRSGTLL